MKRALAALAVAGVVVALVIALPVFTSPPLTSSSSTDDGGFTGDDRAKLGGDGTGTWDGDDGDDDDDDDDGADDSEFQLFGTAQRTRFLGNEVLRLDTFPASTFGGASINLGVPLGALNRKIAFSAYLVNIDCYGGSPRISLRVDLNGDGVSDGNAFGYMGPFASFTGCAQQVWRYQDMTDGGQRWDTSQLVGAHPSTICGSFVCTFAQVAAFLAANFPNNKVLRGSLVQDAFAPIMQGFAFYDDIQIGDEILD